MWGGGKTHQIERFSPSTVSILVLSSWSFCHSDKIISSFSFNGQFNSLSSFLFFGPDIESCLSDDELKFSFAQHVGGVMVP